MFFGGGVVSRGLKRKLLSMIGQRLGVGDISACNLVEQHLVAVRAALSVGDSHTATVTQISSNYLFSFFLFKLLCPETQAL